MAHVFQLGHYNQVESVPMFLVPSGIPGRLDQSYSICFKKINVRKTEGAIKVGQARETVNIGYTRLKTKTNNTKKTTTQYVLDTTMRNLTQIT